MRYLLDLDLSFKLNNDNNLKEKTNLINFI